MATREGIIKVFTKYDTPYPAINIPFIRPLIAQAKGDAAILSAELLSDFRRLTVKRIEQGLEGVRFFHYG